MKIKEFSFKNICSYGNKLQSLSFGDDPKLVMIQGQNGSGKSSISDALTVAIYGKSAIRPTNSIPNRINKNAYTNIKFVTSKGKEVNIERGIDPNFSKLQIDGTEHNLPDKRRVDAFIEEELTKIPFNVFANTISLSVNDFKSFVKLSPNDKRQIIDKIFGLDVVNDMSKISKDETKKIKMKISPLEKTLESNNRLLNSSVEQLERLKNQTQTDNKEKILELEKMLSDLEGNSRTELENAKLLSPAISKANSKIQELRQSQATFSANITDLQKKLQLYSQNKCPHCLSDLTDSIHIQIKDRIQAKKTEYEESKKEIDETFKSSQEELKEMNDTVESSKKAFYQISAQITGIKTNISNLKTKKDDDGVSQIGKIIEEIRENIRENSTELATLSEQLQISTEMESILSDTGMKRLLMSQIIPLLNKKITKTSKILEFKYAFEFDLDFNPIITHLGMQISPDSLSVGEQKKVNLIVLLGILELIKLKHNNVNMLFLDEIFSSLDSTSIIKVVDLLKAFSKKYNMTVFVISNDFLPKEYFDTWIQVENVDHFSDMTVL